MDGRQPCAFSQLLIAALVAMCCHSPAYAQPAATSPAPTTAPADSPAVNQPRTLSDSTDGISNAPASPRDADRRLPANPNDARPLGPFNGDAPDAEDRSTGNWWLQTVVALAIVIGLILLTRKGLQRLGGHVVPTSAAHMVEVLGRTSLGPKTSVLFVKLNHRILVVGQTTAGMNTLAEIDDPEEVAGLLGQFDAARPKSISTGFRGLMTSLDRLYQGQDLEARSQEKETEADIDRAQSELSGLLSRIRSLGGQRDQEGGRP
jgi:flagellar biogenesis protein FliO